MNLLLSPKTADDVILSLDSKWTAKIKKLVGAYFLSESWFLWKLYFKNSYPKTGSRPHACEANDLPLRQPLW